MSTTLDSFDSSVESDRPADCECWDNSSEANLHAKDAHFEGNAGGELPCVPCFLDGFDTMNAAALEENNE